MKNHGAFCTYGILMFFSIDHTKLTELWCVLNKKNKHVTASSWNVIAFRSEVWCQSMLLPLLNVWHLLSDTQIQSCLTPKKISIQFSYFWKNVIRWVWKIEQILFAVNKIFFAISKERIFIIKFWLNFKNWNVPAASKIWYND